MLKHDMLGDFPIRKRKKYRAEIASKTIFFDEQDVNKE